MVLQGGRGWLCFFLKKKKSDAQFQENQYGGKADKTKYSASIFSSISDSDNQTSPTPILKLNGCSLKIGQDKDVVNFQQTYQDIVHQCKESRKMMTFFLIMLFCP